jgi:hypothetical protein
MSAEYKSIREIAEDEGHGDNVELLAAYMDEGAIPACCSEGCMVEPDGICPHGFKSIFLEAGII